MAPRSHWPYPARRAVDHVVVETPRGSRNKYELEEQSGSVCPSDRHRLIRNGAQPIVHWATGMDPSTRLRSRQCDERWRVHQRKLATMQPLRRRAFLATTGLAIAGGCGGPVVDDRAGQPLGTAAAGNNNDGPVVYVALGDSISIDHYAGGAGRGGASLLVRNRDDDFPQWHGRDLTTQDPAVAYHLLATDGGTTSTLLDSQLRQLEASAIAPTVVTLTIGGNDLLGAYGDIQRARQVVSVVRTRVGQALERLRSIVRRPSDPVIVGTVYDPSDGTGDASRLGLPPWPQVVDALAELNTELREAASERGARVADIHGHFLGHGLRAGNPAQSDSRPANRNLWFCNVIEPNAWGASAVRAAFWGALHAG